MRKLLCLLSGFITRKYYTFIFAFIIFIFTNKIFHDDIFYIIITIFIIIIIIIITIFFLIYNAQFWRGLIQHKFYHSIILSRNLRRILLTAGTVHLKPLQFSLGRHT